ncbi:uncharacterized protein N7479_005621 [Penicillium vulpinum]|uniref:RanBP2-type domain-containing protein n=1 Tax=Penicillium vulpinum TaxID=29845 RepID=A0A1V6SG12_9EURO|nr:uncharacterized protein N7479_005621 [Penicillium vulpinum]KAJ5958471.1 hypothetical protein N7479_005621 [Penicillium vulpinum]OQE12710.1 hypothetical protein PENVUL_c001G07141 [Penicillium vulpinum]
MSIHAMSNTRSNAMSNAMSSAMSNAMSNMFSRIEIDSEGQDPIILSHGRQLTWPNDSSYANAMSSPLISPAQPIQAPFPDAISVLTLTPNELSTGAPRLVAEWWRCCDCDNMVNPSLASGKCPICSHAQCGSCKNETVP